jgi:hypothetical protein
VVAGKPFDAVSSASQDGSVTLWIQCVDIDCQDPFVVAAFWQSALGWRRTHEDPDEIVLEPPAGSARDGVAPDLLFLRVPDPTPGKNRLHLDLRPDDQDCEVERLLSLGARHPDHYSGLQALTEASAAAEIHALHSVRDYMAE